MSNALAVATVTQALALLIEHNLHPEIDMAVSVETRKPPADPPTDPTITVFLYQVTHNPSMRNNDLVTRASDGTLLKRPAAAIDLHYVISAYGEETELVGQRLIGSVVRTLHEIPILPRELIEEAAQRPYLEGSDLAESLQKVRFTPTQMDVDETSKLWGMLHNTPYSLSVVYQASLVLLDGHQKPKPAKPVERPEVTVLPFGAPGAPRPPVLGRTTETVEGAAAQETKASETKARETRASETRASRRGTQATKASGTLEAKAAESGVPVAAKAPTSPKGREAQPASGGGRRAVAKKAATDASSGGAPARSRTRTRKATGGAPAREDGRSADAGTGADGGAGGGAHAGGEDSPGRADDGGEG